MNIAVTGASGFLGRRFVDKLVQTNNIDIENILILDRSPDRLKFNQNNVDVIKYDLTNDINYNLSEYANIKDKLDDVDCLVHLAAFVPRSNNIKDDNLEKSIDVNIRGTYNLIELFNNIKQIVFASTLEVYGTHDVLPISEESSTNPISYYGASKLACEKYLYIYGKRNDVNVVILRFSNIYGPGESYNRAIPNFIKNVTNNKSPIIYGDGSELRDYIYVDDAADATICAIQKNVDDNTNSICNIASGDVYTIKEIAEKIIKISGKDLNIIYESGSKRPTNFAFNVLRSREYLDFYPKIGIDIGLTKEYEWYNKWHKKTKLK